MFTNSNSTNSINGGGALLCRDRGEYAGADQFDDVKTLFLALVPPYFLVDARDDSVGLKIFWALLSLVLYPLQLIYFVGCIILLLLVLAPFVAFIWFLLCF